MLVILDGWGWREETADNAVRQAKTPTFDRLWASGPHAFLRTDGREVGLPPGQMGNSEVGHLNIGAGRVVMQDLPRIGDAIAVRRDQAGAGADRPDRRAEKERRHLPPDRPGLARRRAFAPGPRRGAGENPHRRRRADRGARHHRRPRYAAAIGRRRPQALHRGAAERPFRSPPCSGATTRWTATSAGSASAKAYNAIVEAEGPRFPDRAGRDRRRLCARSSSTSSSCRR